MANKPLFSFVFVAAAIGTGLYLSRAPWIAYREQRVIADQQIKDMRASEKARADLVREEARYRSPLGREELARKRNYVHPGEIRVDP